MDDRDRRIEELERELRIARAQLEDANRERALLEDIADSDAHVREAVQAERDRASRERDEALNRYHMAQEMERRRLSEHLHDSAGQYITAIRQYAHLIQRQAHRLDSGSTQQRLLEYAQNIIDHATRLTDATRVILHEQWPDALEQEGLHSAIAEQVEFWQRSNPSMSVVKDLNPLPVFQDAILVFRIAQEWLNNVQRHAEATELEISLFEGRRDGGQRTGTLKCRDNGVGFDPDQIAHGRGIDGIRERARTLGAEVEIDSQPGQGSQLTLSFSLH